MEALFIGTDIGTTSTKSVAFNERGEAVYESAIEYELHTPHAHIAEQDPDEVLEAVIQTLEDVIIKVKDVSQIKFVSFSSAMHSLICLDEKNERLTESITWADTRSYQIAERLRESGEGLEIYERTGTPIHPMTPLTKIMWMEEESPETFHQTARFISIKEYVLYHLFGKFVVDYSIAAAYGCLNMHTLDWDESILQKLAVDKNTLSEVVAPTYKDLQLLACWQERLPFLETTDFVIGSSDGVLANIGMDAMKKGTVAVTIGTSGAARIVHSEPLLDKKGRTFCYPLLKNHWTIGGPVNNGGVILKWAKNELAQSESKKAALNKEDAYTYVTRMAQSVSPGADGVVFHPYLLGERAPIWNAEATGSFFGLRMHHKKAHLLRAVMEGILFNLYEVLELIEAQGGEIKRVYSSGGFARSETWRQMMADVFHLQVSIPKSYESSCFGAVAIGLLSTERIDHLDEVSPMIHHTNEHISNEENHLIYKETFKTYKKIREAMEHIY